MAAKKPRLCARCGNLVGAEDDQCYACGLRLGTPQHGLVAVRGLLDRYGSTTTILAAVLLVFFGGMVVVQGGFTLPRSSGLLAKLMIGFNGHTLVRCGAQRPDLVAEQGEIWRLVTAMFIHGGIVHIAFNVMVLLQLGRICEVYFDARRTFIIFFLSGLAGFIGSFLAGNYSVGASGGVLGLAGAILAKARRSGGGFDRIIFAQLFRWVFFILVIGFVVPVIDQVGHIGGLVAGGTAGYLLIREGGIRPQIHTALFWICLLLTVVCVGIGVVYCVSYPPPPPA